jgi:hypothetical protein
MSFLWNPYAELVASGPEDMSTKWQCFRRYYGVVCRDQCRPLPAGETHLDYHHAYSIELSSQISQVDSVHIQ